MTTPCSAAGGLPAGLARPRVLRLPCSVGVFVRPSRGPCGPAVRLSSTHNKAQARATTLSQSSVSGLLWGAVGSHARPRRHGERLPSG